MSRFWSLPEESPEPPAGIDRDAFRTALLSWFQTARRALPWRRNTDFYRIWISEIMLQQTRVEAVIPYYARFLERFPAVEILAAAEEQDVLAAWSGLGYYSRARKLHQAAREIVARGFPSTHREIGALAGIGPYTSAALASIALGLPHAAVDGNVLRVISRLGNDASEIAAPATRRRFQEAAQELLDPGSPGDFNQAMMELGATVCKPGVPLCAACPVQTFCAARAAGTERALPVKLKKPGVRHVPLDLVVFRRDAQVYLVQRHAAESRLAGFWELPEKKLFPGLEACRAAEFSHQIVNDRFRVRVWVSERSPTLTGGRWLPTDGFERIPLATISRKALAALPRP